MRCIFSSDEILRRHVLPHEKERILAEACDGVAGGHYGRHATGKKILHIGLYWTTLDSDLVDYEKSDDVFQRTGKTSR